MSEAIEVVNPLAERAGAADPVTSGGGGDRRAARSTLAGCTVGFVDNAKPNFALLADDLAQRLVERHGVARVVRHQKPNASIGAEPQVLARLAGECEVVIAGSGD